MQFRAVSAHVVHGVVQANAPEGFDGAMVIAMKDVPPRVANAFRVLVDGVNDALEGDNSIDFLEAYILLKAMNRALKAR